jgi:hypothetical protein
MQRLTFPFPFVHHLHQAIEAWVNGVYVGVDVCNPYYGPFCRRHDIIDVATQVLCRLQGPIGKDYYSLLLVAAPVGP